MEITVGVTAGGSDSQNNTTSNVNIGEKHFPHFRTIGANPLREFGAFKNNNNNPFLENNNNNNLLLLPSSGFKGGLGRGFNLPLEENAERLDPIVTALVNILVGANLGINYIERESNHVKLTEFGGTEAEDPNE